MIRSGDRIATGTGASRRRLTLEEAEAGGLPELMTREEWDMMYVESRLLHSQALNNTVGIVKYGVRITTGTGADRRLLRS